MTPNVYSKSSSKREGVAIAPVVSKTALHSANEIYFKSQIRQPGTIGYTNIKKIASEKEYDEVLDRLMNTGSWWTPWTRRGANKFEQGLMPYGGKDDISDVMNTYMRTGRIYNPRYTPDVVEDYIRVMEYALSEIDKVYGKYEGIVYRCGPVDSPARNFISTAREPDGLNNIITCPEDYHKPFYIIYAKNGHRMEEVQNKINGHFNIIGETEIILDPTTRFEEITEITPEMKELKKGLENAVRDENGHLHSLNVIFCKEV